MNVSTELSGTKLGNYRLERLLGRGRMGMVYQARDEALLRPTAVKILSWTIPDRMGQDPEAWFLAEARYVARINHPNVVQIYGVARHGPHCYIAMEYVDGAPADAWMADHGLFSADRATEILLQMAGALQAAHEADVVHRDVKPGNILIGSDGTAKLGDFGMALYATKDSAPDPVRAGTPLYTAPEIWRGRSATPSTDIYALGATYYYLLTGHPPFEATDLPSLINAHLEAPIPDLQKRVFDAPPGCAQILQRCLAKSPSDRYSSAQMLSWDVRGLLRKMSSLRPSANSGSVRPPSLAPSSGVGDQWIEFFDFAAPPFSAIEPEQAPARGEPFASRKRELTLALTAGSGCTVLAGERGSGRSTLAQQVCNDYAALAPTAYLRLEANDRARSLQQQVLRAFGFVGRSTARVNGEIDALLEQLSSTRAPDAAPALLLLDDVPESPGPIEQVEVLIRAASATRCFQILATGTTGLLPWLSHPSSPEGGLQSVVLRTLDGRETLRYIEDWIASTLRAGAERVMVTPDAALLVAHHAAGNLSHVNRICTCMLQVAARQRTRVLSSWEAHLAATEGVAQPIRQRPDSWPTPEVLHLLNQQRNQLGIATRVRRVVP